ncbi:MAG: twitching motility protein PilT, partial [Caulobacter sp. 35-67-4]
FDRLLIAQALVEGITLVSNETVFDGAGISRLW